MGQYFVILIFKETLTLTSIYCKIHKRSKLKVEVVMMSESLVFLSLLSCPLLLVKPGRGVGLHHGATGPPRGSQQG